MEKNFDGSIILDLEFGIFTDLHCLFSPFKVDLTFGKTLNILEESHSKYIVIAFVQQISLLCICN